MEETIKALIVDEESAVASYRLSIEHMKEYVEPHVIEVLEGILNDELDHIKKLKELLVVREEKTAEEKRLEEIGVK